MTAVLMQRMPGKTPFCVLVCDEVDERLTWAITQRRGGAGGRGWEKLLQQEVVNNNEGQKVILWRYNAAARRDRKVSLGWFHAGMHDGISTTVKSGGRGGM